METDKPDEKLVISRIHELVVANQSDDKNGRQLTTLLLPDVRDLDLAALHYLPHLRELRLGGAALSRLDSLAALPSLTLLDVSQAPQLRELSLGSGLARLEQLRCADCTGLQRLMLGHSPQLSSVEADGCELLSPLAALLYCLAPYRLPRLATLSLQRPLRPPPPPPGSASPNEPLQEYTRRARACLETHYRPRVLAALPGLTRLDGLVVSAAERAAAAAWLAAHIESWAFGPAPPLLQLLRTREHRGRDTSRTTWSALAAQAASQMARWSLRARVEPVRELAGEGRGLVARQFEYDPTRPGELAVGSTAGELALCELSSGRLMARGQLAAGCHVLGVAWLRDTARRRVLAGAEDGSVALFEQHGRELRAVSYLPAFAHLTSLHSSVDNARAAASGYGRDVAVYDVGAARLLELRRGVHERHINVLKFASTQPQLLLTSSFDGSAKLLDLRAPVPAWHARLGWPLVMACWAPHDATVLACGVDNHVVQLQAADGRALPPLALSPRRSATNYSRAYYMGSTGEHICVGSCEEPFVRVCASNTGRLLAEVDLAPDWPPTHAYVQSLRGDPHTPLQLAALVCGSGAPPRVYTCSLLHEPLLGA